MHTPERALVVGGCGLLGRALVGLLRADGRPVRVLDLRPFDGVAPQAADAVESVVGDLRDREAVARACADVGTVYQTASLVDWSPAAHAAVHAVNVLGNRVVLDAARDAGVRRFVYTSSMDVVFDGAPIVDGDESLPYPARHLDPYSTSKMVAEQEVLAADEPGVMRTAVVRPTGIYGPGDRRRFDPLVDMARAGTIWMLGPMRARLSHVYVDNCAHLHRVVERHLDGPAAAGGQAYFAADFAAPFVEFQRPLLDSLGLRYRERRLPAWLARVLGHAGELLWRVPGPHRRHKPLLTRYTIAVMLNDMCFTDARARRELGYAPLVSADEARARTLAWYRRTYAS